MKVYNPMACQTNGPGVGLSAWNKMACTSGRTPTSPKLWTRETGAAPPDGEVGELVMTCLCRQGMPILRYRTRDLTRFCRVAPVAAPPPH